MSSSRFDVIVVGAGPAGAACAAVCAGAGRSVLLLEKSAFPREKVCGDCVNPLAGPVLERLGLRPALAQAARADLQQVRFVDLCGRRIEVPLPAGREFAIKRSVLDQLLLDRARELGAEIRTATPVTAVARGWQIEAGGQVFTSKILVAADGRNSTVARALGLLPAANRDRLALQTHLALDPDYARTVSLELRPGGYAGVADVGGGTMNLCLVGTRPSIAALQTWAEARWAIPPGHAWRSLAPLARRPVYSREPGLLLAGDAARVVEPFTGEGIAYALRSGELAARQLLESGAANPAACAREQARLYAGRLWINELAKCAVLHPRLGTALLAVARLRPGALRFLTAKVVRDG